jgi:hypothetical protein
MLQKPTTYQRKLLKKYKENLSLSEKLFDLSVGTLLGLLGDTSIQTSSLLRREKMVEIENFKNFSF